MAKEMVISASPHETKVALLEDGQVVEFYVEREKEAGLVGSIYKGRVTRVLPGMQSAFVDIGLERDAFLYVSDFFEGLEEYEQVPAPAAELPAFEPEQEPEQPAPPAEAPEPPAASPEPPQFLDQPQPTADEDRQPAFLNAEPPLRLPEVRPEGGPRRGGHRRRRRRGGRGRRPGFDSAGRGQFDRGPRPRFGRGPRAPFSRGPQRPPRGEPREEAPVAPGVEPIILPGESIAKYRDRSPNERRAEAPPVESRAEEPGDLSLKPPSQPHEPAAALAPEPRQNEPSEEFVRGPEADAVEIEPSGSEEQPAETPDETPALDLSEETEDETPPEEPAPLAETPANAEPAPVEPRPTGPDAYPDAMTLLEIQRVREYEGEVGLPPSVRERTAGGVEWQRRDRGRGRGGRRPRRGRVGRRPGRGPQPVHARPSRGQPAIAELLRAGQEIIVQIAKEQMGKKGARITSHVTLPGRFLVFMPTIDHIGISRKIGTSEERARLRRLLLELKGNVSGGFVVRTAAAGCSEEDLRQDIDYLVKLWHDIRVRADEGSAPLLLHSDLNLVERLLRDHLTTEYENIWVDTEEEYAKVVEFVARVQPGLANRIKLFTKPEPIFEATGVQAEIDRALRPKVWLKSGGYIVINHTEALVAIDVNTGKFVGKGSTRLEDTIVKTNLEAVKEITRQIRLRDLGGIIIIDFIDMEDLRNRQRVMRALEDALRNDRSPSKLLSFNEFGLVAITRKRSRQSLERVLCQPCPTCTGTGMVKSLQTLCFEIQAEARKMAGAIDAPELTIRAHPEIVKTLKGKDHNLVLELEEQTGKNILLQSDNNLNFEEYNIY
jgi:ribonuclease G